MQKFNNIGIEVGLLEPDDTLYIGAFYDGSFPLTMDRGRREFNYQEIEGFTFKAIGKSE